MVESNIDEELFYWFGWKEDIYYVSCGRGALKERRGW